MKREAFMTSQLVESDVRSKQLKMPTRPGVMEPRRSLSNRVKQQSVDGSGQSSEVLQSVRVCQQSDSEGELVSDMSDLFCDRTS